LLQIVHTDDIIVGLVDQLRDNEELLTQLIAPSARVEQRREAATIKLDIGDRKSRRHFLHRDREATAAAGLTAYITRLRMVSFQAHPNTTTQTPQTPSGTASAASLSRPGGGGSEIRKRRRRHYTDEELTALLKHAV
jgi:hypothetical protein